MQGVHRIGGARCALSTPLQSPLEITQGHLTSKLAPRIPLCTKSQTFRPNDWDKILLITHLRGGWRINPRWQRRGAGLSLGSRILVRCPPSRPERWPLQRKYILLHFGSACITMAFTSLKTSAYQTSHHPTKPRQLYGGHPRIGCGRAYRLSKLQTIPPTPRENRKVRFVERNLFRCLVFFW